MSINIKKDGKLVKIAPTSYNELTDLPNIESSGDVTYITDESGKNVATIGPGGLSTTGIVVDRITLDGEDVGTKLDSIKKGVDFNDLTNNPISDNNDGTVSFADESGNKIVLIDSEGVTSVEFKADGHKLTEKADQSYVQDQITRLEASAFSGDYNDLENAPIINDTTGSAVFADEQGNQIAKIDAEGVTSVEFIAGTHKLTNKAEKNAPLADFTEDGEHQTVTSAEKTYWSNKSEFSGKFGDLIDSPIVDDNSGELIYTDGTNIIVKIDASGITTTNVAIKEGDVATLIGEKADQTSLDATNNTLTATNATVSTHTTEINNLKTEVANDKTALETFKTETAGNFTAVNKSISDTNDAVDVLENKVSINEEKLEGVQASDGEFTITDGTNIGMKLDSEGLLHVKEVEVAGGRVDERLKDIENYFSTEEDADSNLNKWHEIVDFLNGFEETDQVLENIINTKASKDELSALSTKVDNNNTSVNTRIDGVETAYKVADSVIETAYKAADADLQKDIDTRALQTALDSTNQEVSNIKNNYVTKAEIATEVDTEHLIADNITARQPEFIFFADPNGYKVAEIDESGIIAVDFISKDGDKLTDKADKTSIDALDSKIDNLTTDDISEGSTNKYFTNARVKSAITGSASTIVDTDLTASHVLITNSSKKVAVSSITSTKLGYLTDVTSNIQAQLNDKVATATVTALDTRVGTIEGYFSNAAAKKVSKSLIVKVSGTQMHSYNGSAEKIVNFKAGNNISLTFEGNDITITGTAQSTDISGLESEISALKTGKQDVITNLSIITSNAANGATAYDWGDHASAGYLTKTTADGYYAPKSLSDTVNGLNLTEVKSTPTTSKYYLCGSSSSEEITSILYKRSDVYVNTAGSIYGKSFFETSDETLKNFSNNVEVDFEKLLKLPKKYFTWKDGDDTQHIGTSAQEVQKIYPELVSEGSEGKLTVDYAKLSIVALKAIDELYIKNLELEERLSKIETLLNIK